MGPPSRFTSLAALALIATAPSAWASGKLYKCEGPQSAVAIQSEPCPKGWKQVWAREAAPEPPPTPQQQAAIDAQRRRNAEDARAMARMAGREPASRAQAGQDYSYSSSGYDAAKEGCLAARAHAKDVRDRQWKTLTHDQLRNLDDSVARACKEYEQR